jgi:predicted glutamine amidotransferase
MCELMGMSFAKPIVAHVTIQAFSMRSVENADGWGLAWYPDKSLAMIKQPMRWSIEHTQFLEHYPGLLSSIYVSHVRHKTTGGSPTHSETHPFSRELNGREYCFAHNGTLGGDFWKKPLGRFRPIGSTDSEFLFCLLLDELERFGRLAREAEEAKNGEANGKGSGSGVYRLDQATGRLVSEQQWRWLHQFLLRLNDYGRLNCILTDGERLLVYHDKNAWKNLTYRNIFLHEDTAQHFGDATVAVNLQAQPVNHGVIVATNPLSVEGWERFLPGEMKVLHQGSIAFTSRPKLGEKSEPAQAVESVTVTQAASASQAIVMTENAPSAVAK